MVMEAATLTNPQRKFNVVPVQKSLSLPSYARAGGEGIDHQLIFAALEQKEKVRRKSKIFTREKSSRQTVFCLPIPSSSNRCRETSLSSDTSCSSLEYQKPKKEEAKKKQQDPKPASKKEEPISNKKEVPKHRLNDLNDAKLPSIQQPDTRKEVLTRNATADMPLLTSRTTRLGVAGSSDSMDRSSRSSNDSLGRREWLVAVKARVEAAREKIGSRSSSDEEAASMTRYNSDGLIHKSGRDSTSRPSRYERRVRRRSQDEVALKKLSKKSDLSLYLVEAAKTPANHLEVKTDFCPSPNVPDVVQRKNYFSDFPSRESAAKSVQARIRHIEDEERKRRSGSDFPTRFDSPSRQSPLVFEGNSPAGTESRRTNGLQHHTAFADAARSSPLPRSSQAPTPPPRSPKSITFVNKAFLQHQMQHENSLDRKRLVDQFCSRSEAVIAPPEPRLKTDPTDPTEKQKIRELICSRRKTCGNFDFMDDKFMFSDLTPLKGSPSSNASSVTSGNFPLIPQMKKLESKGYSSSSEMHCSPVEDPASKLWKSKWQENDQKREYMFNSLESKRKCTTPSWLKWKTQTSENDTGSPQSFSNYKSSYTSKEEVSAKAHFNVNDLINQLDSITKLNSKELSSLNIQRPNSDRLSKSEANIALKEKAKLAQEAKENNLSSSSDKIPASNKSKASDKISATANLESAMEELESVYQSLKISSDNLSDKGNTSNSLDDKDLRKSKFSYNSIKDEIGFKRRSSVCESNLSSLHIKSDFQDFIGRMSKKTEQKLNNPMPDLLTCLTPKENITEQLSIDELFNDLTHQLDLEQKLLKDPRDNNKPQTKVSSSQTSRFNNNNPRPSNPQPSQISIRKEFFDNLSKGHQDQSKRLLPDGKEPQPLVKKKYKAVRSLSENISMLMAAANPPAKHNSAMKVVDDNVSKTAAIEQYYERARDPSRRDLPCKSPDITPLNTSSDEIRHIRVSMDTAQPKPVIRDKLPATKHYARLSSAVSSTATQLSSPKQELSPNPSFQDLSLSKETTLEPSGGGGDRLINSLLWKEVPRPPSVVKDPSPSRLLEASSPNGCNSKDSNSDVLEEGLEKLLNRLLGDVPERPQSSLLQSSDVRSPTPPTGEMSVLQHLDVIRLKTVST